MKPELYNWQGGDRYTGSAIYRSVATITILSQGNTQGTNGVGIVVVVD